MTDWIFEGNPRRNPDPRHHDLDAAVTASREQWWGTPRYRDRMAVGDRVWLQIVGPKDPGIYYLATIVSPTYEHPLEPSDPAHFRWRTDIRFDYRVRPPLLRSELLEDASLGSFRPFRGFEGSNVPVPPDIAAALAARAAPRLEPLGLPGRGTGSWCHSYDPPDSVTGKGNQNHEFPERSRGSAATARWLRAKQLTKRRAHLAPLSGGRQAIAEGGLRVPLPSGVSHGTGSAARWRIAGS